MNVSDTGQIGSLIRRRRRALGWSQQMLAERIGASRFWVMQIERGKETAEVGLVLSSLHTLGLRLDARTGEGAAAGLRVKTSAEVGAIMGELRGRLDEIYGGRLRDLVYFGSYARGDAGPESDLDVLIVLDQVGGYMAEVRRAGGVVGALALEHDLSITPVFVAEQSWRDADSTFLRNVRAEAHPAA